MGSVVAWARRTDWMESPFGQALAVIGRNSLKVFCVGLFAAWIISRIMEAQPDDAQAVGALLTLPGIAALWTVAHFTERARSIREAPRLWWKKAG